MANDQYYEKVQDDEASDPLVGNGKDRITRAPPSQSPPKRSALTVVAVIALGITVFLAAVAAVSSAVVTYRLPAATEAALQAKIEQEGLQTPPTSSARPVPSLAAGESGEGKLFADPSIYYGKTQQMKTCGSTPDEARALGCVFDVMMQLWTPPECMDTPLSERFLANGNWTWYADNEAKRIYSDSEIRLGNHDVVYVAQSYHRHHCIFAWERLVRAMRNQAPLIEELISYDHVMHCRHKTLTLPSEGAEKVRGVVAPTGYTKCASYDVWINGNLPFNKMSSIDKLKREMEAWLE